MSTPWWVGGTVYHAYVRSFRDSDGDGYGDLGGLIERFDHFVDLGITALWLSPITNSPDHDWGYDVSDYLDVHPELGTLADLDELVEVGSRHGIHVVMDLIPNHTSASHPWFVEAKSSRNSSTRDYYVWADAAANGSPPNNWVDDTGEPAWTWDADSKQYYMHNFLDLQPDLNWWNPLVHTEFDRIIDFWLDRGVAGFRIDVANGLYHDRELRDNPLNPRAHIWDTEVQGRYGIEHVYNFNRPEVHDVYRHWRTRTESRSTPALLMGETWVARVDELAAYYGDDDQLHLALNFPFLFAPFEPPALARIVSESVAAFPAGAVMVWAGSNHDVPRVATRWAQNDPRRVRLAQTLLATLPGAYVLYYGDELGMVDSDVPDHLHRDPLTAGRLNGQWPRDNARAPMRWDASPSGGFSSGEPWLPVHPVVEQNVADQLADPTSMLALLRTLIAVRRHHLSDLTAIYRDVHVDASRWVYDSGPLRVNANFSNETVFIEPCDAPLLSSLDVRPDVLDRLRPWEAVVSLRTSPRP
ncbi:alpha-amylase [Mycobacterium yunnanensis]|uniref:Alpha-amylase n=1 Tax=Mycobacterium yunnanensis TaxID=368477 RepID=A0A9X2Z7S1_9MYCO|nr:alpha-amylase family glycosyl hydrolase [Mycobacterium yunnanensis]MCV7424518.1 alpha-amylase [Mycobacterium yunnanensis]